ncbi:hypothetical protein EJ110_NYTH00340 [Nymphaea thermarum]|nr:hypothetical protein EJ110_NYTH00340 [Nymphaea thermarum]
MAKVSAGESLPPDIVQLTEQLDRHCLAPDGSLVSRSAYYHLQLAKEEMSRERLRYLEAMVHVKFSDYPSSSSFGVLILILLEFHSVGWVFWFLDLCLGFLLDCGFLLCWRSTAKQLPWLRNIKRRWQFLASGALETSRVLLECGSPHPQKKEVKARRREEEGDEGEGREGERIVKFIIEEIEREEAALYDDLYSADRKFAEL